MANTPTPNNIPPDEAERIVDEVAEGFTDLLPPDLLDQARDFVLDALAGHPLGAQLAERARPRQVDHSAEQAVEGQQAAADDDVGDSGKAGGAAG